MGIYADPRGRSIRRVSSINLFFGSILNTLFRYLFCVFNRVKLAVHNDTKECVAVKIVNIDGQNGLTPDCLKKEVWLLI